VFDVVERLVIPPSSSTGGLFRGDVQRMAVPGKDGGKGWGAPPAPSWGRGGGSSAVPSSSRKCAEHLVGSCTSLLNKSHLQIAQTGALQISPLSSTNVQK